MGAKNHAVILPDAHPEATVAALTGAAFGAAGQRSAPPPHAAGCDAGCHSTCHSRHVIACWSAAQQIHGRRSRLLDLDRRMHARRLPLRALQGTRCLHGWRAPHHCAHGRCMAVSAAVFVGGIGPWREALVQRAQALRVGPGAAAETDVGPLISPEARARAERLVASGVEQVPGLAPAPCLTDKRPPV